MYGWQLDIGISIETVSLPKITLILAKRLYMSLVSVWPGYLHKPNKNSNWSCRLFQICFAGILQETFRLSFSQPLRAQKPSHTAAIWPCLKYPLVWVDSSSSWGPQNVLGFLPCHLSGKQPSFLTWKDGQEPRDQARRPAGPFLQGALTGFESPSTH